MSGKTKAARVWAETRGLLAFMGVFYMSMDAGLWLLETAGMREWPNLSAVVAGVAALAAARAIVPDTRSPGGHQSHKATGPKSPPRGSRAVPPKPAAGAER